MNVLRSVAALVLIGALTAVLRISTAINPATAGFVYLITILLIAARWGLSEALVASIAATLSFNYFFFPPVGTLHIEDPENWISLAAFLVTSLVASQLSEMARRNQDRAMKAESERQSEQFKSTLVDAVAHEFKTPLTSIKAATSTILCSDGLTTEQQRELFAIIDQEADRLTSLTREALHLARAEAGKLHLSKKPHEVRVLIEETLAHFPQTSRDRRMQVSCEKNLPNVDVDRDLFVIALRQLIDNALKYSPADTPVRIHADASEGVMWVRVHSQGPGLTEREQAMVFDRYYRSSTTSKRIPGTGMGLGIAQDIVKAHGGNVTVESGPGLGTEFSIRLPLPQPGPA